MTPTGRPIRAGFPHSDIFGSKLAPNSPKLVAGCHVLHRLYAPRHPPNALITLEPPPCTGHSPPHDTAALRFTLSLPPTEQLQTCKAACPHRPAEDLSAKTHAIPQKSQPKNRAAIKRACNSSSTMSMSRPDPGPDTMLGIRAGTSQYQSTNRAPRFVASG